MDACFLFIVLHVFLPIGGNSLDADSVFDILDSKINILDSKIENDVRTLKMRLRSERQQRLRFENMVQSSLHDLHLVLNMSSDGGDLTTVSFQFHAIETKLGEFQAQISEEHRSRVEQNRIFQQKLNEQDILLEQERKMIKTLSSKVEVQEEISREKAEEIKSLKNELGETQNELMGIKFAHGRGAEESRYAGALTSLVVAFQKEKTLRSSLTAKVRGLEQKSNCSILKEGQFENRVLDVERSLDSFSKFKESISAVVEKRLVHLNTDVEDLTENLTEAVKMTNDIQISIERLIKNVTKTEEDVKKIQAGNVAVDVICRTDAIWPCSDANAVCNGVNNMTGTCTCNLGYTKSGSTCVAAEDMTLDGPCNTDATRPCSDPNSVCGSVTDKIGTCICGTGYQKNGSTCVAAEDMTLDGPCNTDATRPCSDPNSVCGSVTNKIGTCICGTGYQKNGPTCVAAEDMTLDGPCNTDATRPCSDPNSVCGRVTNKIGTCICGTGYNKNGSTCVAAEDMTLDGPCNTDATRPCSDPNSVCSRVTNKIGTCICGTGYNKIGSTCVAAKDVALDGQCNPDSTRPCSDPKAVCGDVTNEIGTCTCRIGYTKNGFMCEAGRLTQEYKNQIKTWIGGGVDHFQLLYSATRDGCSASSFHQHCDNHGPTVTVIYQQQNGQDNVFGGYTSLNWTGNGDYRTDALAFLFVLRINGTENYISMPIIKIEYGIYDNREFGPVFGGGHDLRTFRSRCNRESNQFYTDGYTHLWGFARNDNATAVFQYKRVKHLKSFSEQEVYKVT